MFDKIKKITSSNQFKVIMSVLSAFALIYRFYILYLDRAKGVPPGGFGITNHPDELYHLVMDILVRNRI